MTDAGRRTSVLTALVAAAVGIAFADSSIVVLGLPELYARFHTSIEGVSWVVTAYNASVACSLAGGLPFLIAARCVQGAGAALLLAGALPVLGDLTGSVARGAAIWTFAGTLGAALGPALGGIVTQALDWRAIF